jgi:putative transposase
LAEQRKIQSGDARRTPQMPSFDADRRRLRLIEQILHLPEERLAIVEQCLLVPAVLTASGSAPRDWPHAPLHRLSKDGTFLVTAGTYNKEHVFRGGERLDYLESTLLAQAKAAGWHLEAWAVFSNHYHFICHLGPGAVSLAEGLKKLHQETAGQVNRLDQVPGRQVWFNYWDTELTFEKLYLARLNYVHQNAVKHGLVPGANQYRWCSAAWLERTATPAQVRTIYSFKTDRVHVHDDFDPV